MPCVVGIQNGALPWVFGKAFSRGFFVQLVAHSAPAANRHIHSLRPIRLIFTAPIDFSARRCERIRTLNPLRAEALRDLAIGIDAGEMDDICPSPLPPRASLPVQRRSSF